VSRLEVVGAPVGVVIAAARVVHAPAPADVDPVVGQVVDLVVADRRAGDVGGQHGRGFPVVGPAAADPVVADGDVLVGHRRVGRVVGIGLDPADRDPAARLGGERVAGDGDVAGAQAHPAGVGVGVLADPESDLAQVGERVAAEGDVGGRGHLHRGGHLVPVLAGGLELRTAAAAAAVGRLRPVPGDERAGLLVHVALVAAR